MITAAPLLHWRDLSSLFTGAEPDDARLAGPWRRTDETAFWFSRGAWAMKAIALWWEASSGRTGPSLWLPDYFCNQSTAPLRETGARLTFYPVGADLEPRWEDCQRLAREIPPELFVLVHYFGRPADARAAKAFCWKTGARLIEDAAHVLVPVPGVGEHGDMVFYCPHKTIATPDGAVLLVRDADAASAMTEAIARMGQAAPAPWVWLTKRILQQSLPPPLRGLTRRPLPAFMDDPPFAPLPPTPRLSRLARRMLARAADELPDVVAARRRNAQALRRAMEHPSDCRVLFSNGDRVPYRFVLRCADPGEAAVRFEALRGRGCPVESWPDLPPEVLADADVHADALSLRRTLLLLPIHQSATTEALVACCRHDGAA